MSELLQVITAGAEDVSSYVRIVVSGAPGSGKTTFATTAPNVIWAAAAPGFSPLAKQGIRYVNIGNENDLFNLKLALEEGSVEADTLVIDSVDELQRRLFIQKLKADNRNTIKNEDWNWVEAKMNGIFDSLSELPIHIIYITHTKDVGGFDGVEVKVKNNLMGSIANQIYKYVDYAVFIERKAQLTDLDLEGLPVVETEVTSTIRTKPTQKFPVVFDGSDSLPDFIEVDDDAFFTFVRAQEERFDDLSDTVSEEIEVGKIEEIEDEPEKKTDIPGMSNQSKIASFLK